MLGMNYRMNYILSSHTQMLYNYSIEYSFNNFNEAIASEFFRMHFIDTFNTISEIQRSIINGYQQKSGCVFI